MTFRKPFYLATPYTKWPTGHDDANSAAAELAAKLMTRDIPVFSPITHSHIIAKFLGPDAIPFERWEELDLWAISASCGMLVAEFPGWRESSGITREIVFARANLISVDYIDPRTLHISHQPHTPEPRA